jgi:hypothetical protein
VFHINVNPYDEEEEEKQKNEMTCLKEKIKATKHLSEYY